MSREAKRDGDIYNILKDLVAGSEIRWNADGKPTSRGSPSGTVIAKETSSSLYRSGGGSVMFVTLYVERYDTGGTEQLVGLRTGPFKAGYVFIPDSRNLNRLIHLAKE